MFRRQLLRQSRTISESLTTLPQVRRSPFSSATLVSPRSTLPASYSSRIARRWQSSEAENKPAESRAASSEDAKPAEAQEDPVKQELEKAKKEAVDLKDKYLRSVADYRNLQERTRREVESAKQFGIQRFATDLLESIDNFDRAIGSVPEAALGNPSTTSNTSSSDANAAASTETTSEPNKDLLNLYSGLKMTEEILMNVLKKHGLERFDPLEGGGRKFDPNTDEATFFTKVEGKQDGDVFYTQSKGYKLNGRVVRAAKVGVVKNS
ncbi:GrpE, mitochondrial [Elasticomyces elasticus]|uniref:GrpE protein homolog, mitochondrial n=1 Tax=Exophiala sideris TaxID=1016849 RepID=A0ABR0JSH9_9EURO|nr:GrpE, mitochondrial [Elasticomyces elasticus]KAK5040262.1 GrpE, mitochondrial [Exophiala sideris]KAK5043312.1 GrpE, mitochondrial [Exophiala sideris]KAK5068640.1 GrpE, mitochondrial [Exophiala sideris]KAK5186238.1 GrpE, mitochondrial [Eurotiomycetes sp. CCFEE 6388]